MFIEEKHDEDLIMELRDYDINSIRQIFIVSGLQSGKIRNSIINSSKRRAMTIQ